MSGLTDLLVAGRTSNFTRANTGDNSFWVSAKDQLSLSLLALAKVQGRVIGSHD